MAGGDNWEEALDVDDSDLPSLLRPCKRAHHHTSSRTIPGPAGPVQAAMLRKTSGGGPDHFNSNPNAVISTQEYVRRAVEDTAEFDDDFNRQPWLSALQFLGVENGAIPSTPISSVKKWRNVGKVDRVVAVVKSSTPNGLGGLIVLLKDPTGTVGASIHHKVLSESEFGKAIASGSVLIVKEVAVFTPARSAHYLNITLRNLVKVFSQDAGSTSKLSHSLHPFMPSTHHCAKSDTTVKTSNPQNLITNNTQCMQAAENSQDHSVIPRQNLYNGSCIDACADGRTSQMNLIEDTSKEFVSPVVHDLEGILVDNTENLTSVVSGCGGAEIHGPRNEGQVQRQTRMSKASLPEWTEEQLDELFAGDEDDDSSLF